MLDKEEMRNIVFCDNPKYKAFVILHCEDVCGYCILAQYRKREAYDSTSEVVVYLRHDRGGIALKYLEDVARPYVVYYQKILE